MIRDFISDTKGNFSVLFGITIFVCIFAIGVVIDVAQTQALQSRLQAVSDSSALAATKGKNIREMHAFALASIEAQDGKMGPNWDTTLIEIIPQKEGSNKTVKVKITGEFKTSFSGALMRRVIKFGTYSEVTEDKGNIEIAMVLDVSYSMSGAKIRNLKKSASEFIDVIMGDDATSPNTSMTIVPFGGNVNLGSKLAGQLMPVGTANWNPSDSDYRSTAASPDNKADALYRFTNGMNCVETKLEDYSTNKISDNSRSQLPRFVNKNSLLTICPEDESSTLFNSGNKQVLKNRIKELVLSHGTAMDVGANWGLKTLSPSHRGIIGGDFSDRPADFDGLNQKVMIIMTDGNITGQARPRKINSSSKVNQSLYDPGTSNSTSSTDDAVGRFKKVCEAAQANDVTVFTIGFRIKRGSIADDLLDYCATDSSKYYFVETVDPSVAFNAIAKSVSQLRIVQ